MTGRTGSRHPKTAKKHRPSAGPGCSVAGARARRKAQAPPLQTKEDVSFVCSFVCWGLQVFTPSPPGRCSAAGVVLQLLRCQDPPCPWEEACSLAAEGGHLATLQWLRSQDPPCPWDELVCSLAARSGHLATLQWLRPQEPRCPWDEEACARAAEGGHLGVLRWPRSQAPPCPWDEQVLRFAHYAERQDIVQWAQENGAPDG